MLSFQRRQTGPLAPMSSASETEHFALSTNQSKLVGASSVFNPVYSRIYYIRIKCPLLGSVRLIGG